MLSSHGYMIIESFALDGFVAPLNKLQSFAE